MPVLTVKPDGTKLFAAWYDRRNSANNLLIDVYGRWGTIASDGTVTFGTEFRITTASFPPVFGGTLPSNKANGHYDPVYPPGGVNLHWYAPFSQWPEPPPPPEPDFNVTPVSQPPFVGIEGHVGEYNGAWSEGQYVYMSWTDSRLTSIGTIFARSQRDIRLIRVTWPQ